MPDPATTLSNDTLDQIFPPSRTDAFFEALFGGTETGAYDIRLRFEEQTPTTLHLAFHLIERPGQCLACNLTYGLPQVFARHPILAVGQTVTQVCDQLGLSAASWSLEPTREVRRGLHLIPLHITLA